MGDQDARETYRAALEALSEGRHERRHDLAPWLQYSHGGLIAAYFVRHGRRGRLRRRRAGGAHGDSLLPPRGHRPCRSVDLRITGWAGQSPLEPRERIDDLNGLEGSIAPPYRDLLEHPRRDQIVDRPIGCAEAAPEEIGGPAHGEDGRARQGLDQQINRGVAPHRSEARSPTVLDLAHLTLESPASPTARVQQPANSASQRLSPVVASTEAQSPS